MRRLILLSAWVACAFACSETPEPTPATPRLLAFVDGTPFDEGGRAAVSFGDVHVGRRARIAVVVENRSDRTLRLEPGALSPPFFFVETPATELPPLARQSLLLGFEPTGEGGAQARLTLRSAGGNLEAQLSGRGVSGAGLCDFRLDPAVVHLTDVGVDIPWHLPITLEVLEGPCTIDELGTAGDLGLEASGVEHLTILPGLKATVQLAIASPHSGSAGTVSVRAGEVERKVRVETKPEPSCVKRPDEPRVLNDRFRCTTYEEISFDFSCPEPERPSITSVGIWPNEGTSNFSARRVGDDRVELSYLAAEPVEREKAWAVVDFDQGDRLLVPLEGEAQMVEDRFRVPEMPLDLLIVVDKGEAMEAHLPALASFADELVAWMEETNLDVRIGVTTAAIRDGEGCPGESGALLPLDGSRPRFVDRTTPDFGSVLRANLQVDACMEAGQVYALEAAVRALENPTPSWMREGARRAVIVFASEESREVLADYHALRDALLLGDVNLFFAAGPNETCGVSPPSWSALRTAAQNFGGLYVSLCAPQTWSRFLVRLELEDPSDRTYPLSVQSSGRREDDGVTLRADGKFIPSSGSLLSPPWNVEGTILRVYRGLPPGTELLLRYPPWTPDLCFDD